MAKQPKQLSQLFTWRSALCDSDLHPTTRHVALTLSLHMSERGDSAHPGGRLLAAETGLTQKTVYEHLQRLEDAGWLVVLEEGTRGPSRRGEKRLATKYAAAFPTEADRSNSVTGVIEDGDRSLSQPYTGVTPTQQDVTQSDKQDDNFSLAQKIAADEWERRAARGRRPVCGFPALRTRVREALDAGHPPEALTAVLPSMTSFTRDSFDYALRDARVPRPTNAGRVESSHNLLEEMRR